MTVIVGLPLLVLLILGVIVPVPLDVDVLLGKRVTVEFAVAVDVTVERDVVVCVFEPILDTEPVVEEVPVLVALDVAETVEHDVPVFDDDILEVAVADVIRLKDMGGDLDPDVDPVEERVARVEND